MRTSGAYPERRHPRAWLDAVVIFGTAGVIVFALTFALAWLYPTGGTIWLVVGSVQFLSNLAFSRKAVRANLVILISIFAAVFAAAAFH